MKKLSFILFAAAAIASCKGKDSLQSDKNIVVLTDTSRAAGNYLSDTGRAKMPVTAVAAAPARSAPVTRTPAVRQRNNSSVYRPGTSTSTTTTTTTNNGGTGTTTTASRKQGWSKSANGAVIGGVGGAVLGAVVGKGKGAVIGGVLGAGGGYIIGRSQDKKDGRIP